MLTVLGQDLDPQLTKSCSLSCRNASTKTSLVKQESWAAKALTFSFCLLLFLSAGGALILSRKSLLKDPKQKDYSRAPLYLPEAKHVRLITLGYDTLASKILWFSTINYFGRQFALKADYRWLGEMCEVVTELDPKATHSVEFCATLLPWVAKDPQKGVQILSSAIAHQPNYWRYYYLRGFTYWFFLEDNSRARADMEAALKQPECPEFINSLRARLLALEKGPDVAKTVLEELIANTDNPLVVAALKRNLRSVNYTLQLEQLNTALGKYREKTGELPNTLEILVETGLIPKIPLDPYQGRYFIDPATSRVKSTSNKKATTMRTVKDLGDY